MNVYELINKLLEAPAGANVYIGVSEKLLGAKVGEEILLEMVFNNNDPMYVTLTTNNDNLRRPGLTHTYADLH